jgi:predicted ATPase/DNA-binding CsgD family transcriptional regulator
MVPDHRGRAPRPETIGGNLPAERSSFVGRRSELARLIELQKTTRLLTLVGPGGVGKSRLAVRLAASVRNGFLPDGRWLVDVGTLPEPSILPRAIADVLGIRERDDERWQVTLAEGVRGRRLLLLLDNCDQHIATCADLTLMLLRASSDLRVLVTSREPLGVEGEVVWRVPPLSLAAPGAHDLAHVQASEAVALFVARAGAVLADFALMPDNAAMVADLCQRLEGLPLAIELVAARTGSLGLSQIAARLDAGFALGLRGRPGAPARQYTLRATLDWSYALLDEEERLALARLAVFVGGWTLPAAEAVCADDALPIDHIADVLERLVTKSLVQADQQPDGVRYRYLETVRDYALERLSESELRPLIERRHAAYMLALAELAPPDASDVQHAAVLEPEQENLRAALRWALREGDAELGLRLATAAYTLWYFRGRYAEGYTWLEQMLALPGAADAVARVDALCWAGQLLHLLGRYADAEIRLRAALNEYHQRSDARGVALTLLMLGNVCLWRGDLVRASELHGEAATRLHDLGNRAELVSLFQSAVARCELGDLREAQRLAARCEMLGGDGQRPVAIAAALHLRGLIAARSRRPAQAIRIMHEAIDLERRLIDQQRLVETLTELGHIELEQGRGDEALKAFTEAAHLAMASGERICLIRALEGVARAVVGFRSEIAVQLAAASAHLRGELGAVAWPHDRDVLRTALAKARSSMRGHAYARAWEAGELLGEVAAIAMVETLQTTDVHGEQPRWSDASLTSRERDVIELLAQGLSTRQIAAQLVISPGTARTHLEHIMAKFGLHSRVQVVAWATQGRGRSGREWQRSSRPAD